MTYRICEHDTYEFVEVDATNVNEAVDKVFHEHGWANMDAYVKIEDDWSFDGNYEVVAEVKGYGN